MLLLLLLLCFFFFFLALSILLGVRGPRPRREEGLRRARRPEGCAKHTNYTLIAIIRKLCWGHIYFVIYYHHCCYDYIEPRNCKRKLSQRPCSTLSLKMARFTKQHGIAAALQTSQPLHLLRVFSPQKELPFCSFPSCCSQLMLQAA